MFTDPTVADFKTYFFRDFPYGTSLDDVQDQDITNALADVQVNFNPGLWNNQDEYTLAFLNLAAHNLVMNLSASAQGVAGRYTWLQGSKSVGSVSGSYQIPQKILDNPVYAMYSKTNYGAKYLMLVLPRLVGQIFTVRGHTKP